MDTSAHAFDELAPPASLTTARELRDDLARLLARERTAAADFLLALADFDRRRGWAALGHASLFAFLHRELGLSKGGAFFRLTAARLVQRFPEVIDPLRTGRLCITTVVEVARVLTPENLTEVLPRFFGCSAREAKEVSAKLAPRESPPRREVVTTLPSRLAPADHSASPPLPWVQQAGPAAEPRPASIAPLPAPVASRPAVPASLPEPDACGAAVQSTEPPPTHPTRAPLRDDVEPLTAELRRLHVTVSRRFLEKVGVARDGLSHAVPGATTEQVLEAALDLLLEKQAQRRGLVNRPRSAQPHGDPAPRYIPAAVRREVWLRDGSRCQHPLDSGGVCGSTIRLELDHVVPVALGGPSTASNLLVTCRIHNREAARRLLGEVVSECRQPRRGRGHGSHPK